MSKVRKYHIVLSSTGGELDNKIVLVKDGENESSKIQIALLEMIEDMIVQPGDIFSIVDAGVV